MPRYIEADNIEKALVRYADSIDKTQTFSGVLRLIVRDTPTAGVVPVKRGKWMHDSTGANFCSECGMYPYDDGEYHMVWHAKFCPNCGAMMGGENDG